MRLPVIHRLLFINKLGALVTRVRHSINIPFALAIYLRNLIFVMDIMVFAVGGALLLESVSVFWKPLVVIGIIVGLGVTLIEVGWVNAEVSNARYGIATNIFGSAFLTIILTRTV